MFEPFDRIAPDTLFQENFEDMEDALLHASHEEYQYVTLAMSSVQHRLTRMKIIQRSVSIIRTPS